MTTSPPPRAPLGRTTRLCAVALLAAGLWGCASDAEKMKAIQAVNDGFRIEYEKLLREKGSRVYAVNRSEAFVAMRVALSQLGMHTERQDPTLGYLAVTGDAPAPLSADEWRTASEADLPLLRRLITPHVGAAANFVVFEPQGLQVVITATFLNTPGGTEVALTVRLREIAAPRSGWPRREYIAPHLLTVGIEKIFATYERELRLSSQR